MPKDYFGEQVAAGYDESSADMFQPAVVDPVVDFLADLAGHGAALELGIGTGRIALPLARRGIRVHGIDMSEAMVARLRAGAGPDGPAGRHDPARALERLGQGPVHRRRHQARLGLGEAGVTPRAHRQLLDLPILVPAG
jgi:SAM-dependent methyltransferase